METRAEVGNKTDNRHRGAWKVQREVSSKTRSRRRRIRTDEETSVWGGRPHHGQGCAGGEESAKTKSAEWPGFRSGREKKKKVRTKETRTTGGSRKRTVWEGRAARTDDNNNNNDNASTE